jgi:Protein of unknown function (DUF5672)
MTIVLVPIYKPRPDAFEVHSMDVSFAALAGRRIAFIGPAALDLDFYAERYPGVDFIGHEASHFASIPGYNRLLLQPAFYEQHAQHEFMLILQTDAIVLRDELDHWCAQPFDYVGAPWPDPVELFVNLDRFRGMHGRRVRAAVGNGGLSLRRSSKCARLLREFPEATEYFARSGSSEDLYFSLLGQLSADFVLPNEVTASRFAMELKPSYYYEINGRHAPMGGHAWWKYEPLFWGARLADAGLPTPWPRAEQLPALHGA